MLEFFRRHRGAFLITLTAAIIISMFYYGVSQTTGNREKKLLPTDVALTVYGKDYNVADVQRAQRSVQFTQYYLQSNELSDILQMLPSFGGLDAFSNLFVARHLMEELGIRPNNEEARAALDNLPALQNNGKLDVARGQMLEQLAASMGFDSEALLDIMKDIIGLRKLRELVTQNYTASPLSAEKQYVSSYQTFKGSKIVFETETFKKAATVTDDEIKKYYEENKENYKTAEKRAVRYVFFEKPRILTRCLSNNARRRRTQWWNGSTLSMHLPMPRRSAKPLPRPPQRRRKKLKRSSFLPGQPSRRPQDRKRPARTDFRPPQGFNHTGGSHRRTQGLVCL